MKYHKLTPLALATSALLLTASFQSQAAEYRFKALLVHVNGASSNYDSVPVGAPNSYKEARANMLGYLTNTVGYDVTEMDSSEVDTLDASELEQYQSIFDMAYQAPQDSDSSIKATTDVAYGKYKLYLERVLGGVFFLVDGQHHGGPRNRVGEKTADVLGFIDSLGGNTPANAPSEKIMSKTESSAYNIQNSNLTYPNPIETITLDQPGVFYKSGNGQFISTYPADNYYGSGLIFEGAELSALEVDADGDGQVDENSSEFGGGTVMVYADVELFQKTTNLDLLGNVVKSNLLDRDEDGVPDYVERFPNVGDVKTDSTDPSDFFDEGYGLPDSSGGVPSYIETDNEEYIALVGGTASKTDALDDDLGAYYSLINDSDGDGVPNAREIIEETNPDDYRDFLDTDKDGVPDAVEFIQSTEDGAGCGLQNLDYCKYDYRLGNNGDPSNLGFKDSDGGGIPDYVEKLINRILTEEHGVTDPTKLMDITNSDDDFTFDTDGGGVPDAVEIMTGGMDINDPADDKTTDIDDDNDGVPDVVENIQFEYDCSNPDSPVKTADPSLFDDAASFQDQDCGGIADYVEQQINIQLENAGKTERMDITVREDDFTLDTDEGGIPDSLEFIANTDILDPIDDTSENFPDGDNDGVPSMLEPLQPESDCSVAATPGFTGENSDPSDGKSFLDTDCGGIPDYVEGQLGQDINDATDDFLGNGGGTHGNGDTDDGGVMDIIEILEGTIWPDKPEDDEGKDEDGDGVPDVLEPLQPLVDCSVPSEPKPFDPVQYADPDDELSFRDSDCGGVADYVETLAGQNINDAIDDYSADTDNGGVIDVIEIIEGDMDIYDATDDADYEDKDTDGDGVPDILEPMQSVFDCTDPENPVLTTEASDPSDPNSFRDSDCGGMSDYREGQLNSLDEYTYDIFDPLDDFQLSAPEDDSDGDGVPDVIEELDGTDPEDPTAPEYLDTDGGGMADYLENQLTNKCTLAKIEDPAADCSPMDILNPDDDYRDDDGDGMPNGLEIIEGTDPEDGGDVDGTDSDGDGVPDSQEVIDGTDPTDKDDFKDTDGGGESDFSELMSGKDKTSPNDDFKAVVETDDSLLIGNKIGSLSIHWLLLLIGAGFIRLSNKRRS